MFARFSAIKYLFRTRLALSFSSTSPLIYLAVHGPCRRYISALSPHFLRRSPVTSRPVPRRSISNFLQHSLPPNRSLFTHGKNVNAPSRPNDTLHSGPLESFVRHPSALLTAPLMPPPVFTAISIPEEAKASHVLATVYFRNVAAGISTPCTTFMQLSGLHERPIRHFIWYD
jgi:hypothetical protein